MNSTQSLVLGTRNRGKGVELCELLGPHGFRAQTLAEFPDSIEVVEDGDSFAANATLKAVQQARHLQRWVLGEDSGIVVDALDGAPGIYSARFAGPDATDEQNNRLLLSKLSDVPLEQRTAHYVCHMTLADSQGMVVADCEAHCFGRIALQPAGEAGFGYDPLFEVIEYHRTFGQLGSAVKSAISHRARAMRRMLPQIVDQLSRPHSPASGEG